MPSSICVLLADEFSRSARAKDDEYAEWDRVRIESGSAAALRAVVIGTQAYRVEIDCHREHEGVAVEASCECPVFEEHATPCGSHGQLLVHVMARN